MTSEAAEKIAGRQRRMLPPFVARWGIVLLCLVPAGFYYFWMISIGFPNFFERSLHGLTFNSMLLHLLEGSFDVDPQTIGDEGTLRDGKVFAYFGILPALLRLPFLAFPGFPYTDYTRLSCLIAICVMAAFKLASVLTVWQAKGRRDRSTVIVIVAVAILLGGPQIQFLRAAIYQEVVLWAAALATAFIYFFLRGYHSEQGFGGGTLLVLATVAGLCLLTRVSTALGLYIAFGLLWLQLAWRALRATGFAGLPPGAVARFLPSAAILGLFVAITGAVNYGRFGSPTAFTDPQHYLWAMIHGPDRLLRDAEYGLFNIIRAGYGLMYYFVPIWVLRGADGDLLWAAFQHRTIDTVELPPSSFFITDPLTIGLAVFGGVMLVRRCAAIDCAIAAPVLAGLFVPIALMLTWVSMTFRYRLEFYPFFDLCAFLGLGVLLSRPKQPPYGLLALAAVVGVVASHIVWLLYMLSPLGDATPLLGDMDIISYYGRLFR